MDMFALQDEDVKSQISHIEYAKDHKFALMIYSSLNPIGFINFIIPPFTFNSHLIFSTFFKKAKNFI